MTVDHELQVGKRIARALFYATEWRWPIRLAAKLPSPDWFGHKEET